MSISQHKQILRRYFEDQHLTADQLVNQFRFNQTTISRLLSDVSQEDSLRHPTGAGNSINWLLGHLISSRGRLLAEIRAEPEWLKELAEIYRSKSPQFPSMAKPISELVRLADDSMRRLTTALHGFESHFGDPSDELPHLGEGGTMADRIGAFLCHEAYHIGQIGLSRRLLGKPGLF